MTMRLSEEELNKLAAGDISILKAAYRTLAKEVERWGEWGSFVWDSPADARDEDIRTHICREYDSVKQQRDNLAKELAALRQHPNQCEHHQCEHLFDVRTPDGPAGQAIAVCIKCRAQA